MFGKSKLLEKIEILEQENEQLKDKLRKYEPIPRKKTDVLDSDYNQIKAKIMAGKKYQEFSNAFDKIKDNILKIKFFGGINFNYVEISLCNANKELTDILREIKTEYNKKNGDFAKDWYYCCSNDFFLSSEDYVISVFYNSLWNRVGKLINKNHYFKTISEERDWSKTEREVIYDLVSEKTSGFTGYYSDTPWCYLRVVPNISVELSEPY